MTKKKVQRDIPVTNEIKMFLHCKRCIAECMAGEAPGESPSSYARLEVGWTDLGLQVWCLRHDINCMHVDFQNQTHPANLAAAERTN